MRMLVSQTPVRLSMGGGGTDVAAYYEQYGGFWTSATISQYVYLTVCARNDDYYVIKYSNISEQTASISEIKHELIRESLKLLNFQEWRQPFLKACGLEINVISDVQGYSGLGVSGAITVGLLQILHSLKGDTSMNRQDLAEEAYYVEHDLAGSQSTGKQDQYIAAYGGITSFEVDKLGKVTIHSLELNRHTISELEDNIVLFGTRLKRKKTANETLQEVTKDLKKTTSQSKKAEYLTVIKEIGIRQREALLHNQPDEFGVLLDQHWAIKKKYCGATESAIEHAYQSAKKVGALGGKVIGASTSGAYIMFYCTSGKEKLRPIMDQLNMIEVPWSFENTGSRIIHIH